MCGRGGGAWRVYFRAALSWSYDFGNMVIIQIILLIINVNDFMDVVDVIDLIATNIGVHYS